MKLDCRRCSQTDKIEKGCDEDSPIPGVWKLKEWEFQRCPLKLVTRKSLEYVLAYIYYSNGYLPNPGGWMEQPQKLLSALEIIERELEAIRQSKYDKQGT